MESVKAIDNCHFISNGRIPAEHIEGIKMALDVGVTLVQLRMKDAGAKEILNTAVEVSKLCARYRATFILNDKPEFVVASGAHGVHLGKEDMPIKEARKLLGASYIIGGTANTFADIGAHVQSGADYVGLGPWRFTQTKKKLSPLLGEEGISSIVNECKKNDITIPIVAIGGIEEEDVTTIMKLGVHGIAFSSLLLQSNKPKELFGSIKNKIEENYVKNS